MSEIAELAFKGLVDAFALIPDYKKGYERVAQVFRSFIDAALAGTSANFSGTFAKVDYLLKEYNAPRDLSLDVNETRHRLRFRFAMDYSTVSDDFLCDLSSLARFVSLVTGVSVPSSLPVHKSHRKRYSSVVSDCIRALVDSWDGEWIYCRADDYLPGEIFRVALKHPNDFNKNDWSYICEFLCVGSQINLVRPRNVDGALIAEIIVFEPDILINVSSIAGCFAPYDESAKVNLIKSLEKSVTNEAIVLGNFAGLLLDETINQLPSDRPYTDSVKKFFKNNAFGLIDAEISPQFHPAAQAQKRNIENAINEFLPANIKNFDSKEGIVEPSFFCEMLGLQGRMDFIQADFKILLEQKSGKAGFPYGNFDVPSLREEHYVQILLYMLVVRYNFRDVYERNNRQLHAFLLYSKYSESMLGVGFSPKLVHRAMKVRNELAFAHLQYAKPGGFRVLERMSADSLNVKGASGPLWSRFLKPQLEDVLMPLRRASVLEREYFFRFMEFVACEHLCGKIGSRDKPGSGFASAWLDSIDDKLRYGNIVAGLTLTMSQDDLALKVESVTFAFSDESVLDMVNFRVGDVVVLYPYTEGCEPDIRDSIVIRCSIEDIGSDSISLRLRYAQSDGRLFNRGANRRWAIEHDFMEVGFSSLYKGLHSFLSAPRRRKDLLLLQRRPETDSSVALNGSYGAFDDMMLKVKQAKDFFIIIGPPGTGKTSFGMLNTLKEQLLEEGTSVLLLSFTNRAVDEICDKLVDEGIDFIRVGNELGCASRFVPFLVGKKIEGIPKISLIKDELRKTRVFVGTVSSVNANLSIFSIKNFSLAIIDEASQILEPHLMGILSAVTRDRLAIEKFVMIGDHKQLPAVVTQPPEMSVVSIPSLLEIGLKDCRYSLFERLLMAYSDNSDVVYMLTKQGRMHREVAEFANLAFYEGALDVVPLPHQLQSLPKGPFSGVDRVLKGCRVAFISVQPDSAPLSDKVNVNEANIISELAMRIYESKRDCGFDPNTTLGIIVPYRSQIASVKRALDSHGVDCLRNVTVDTVERFQGSQRDYIIYGFTVSYPYQLDFLAGNVFEERGAVIDRKLNVAMTRAKEHLVLVGNDKLLQKNALFNKLISYIKQKDAFFLASKLS